MLEKETPLYKPTEIELEIADLRHQLITLAIYQDEGLPYAEDFSKAPPITIAQEDKENGAVVHLYLDNMWGVKQGRIHGAPHIAVPHIIMQNWATIRHPEFRKLQESYNQELDAIEQQRQVGQLRSFTFNELFNTAHCEYFHAKNELTLQLSDEIKQGIHTDLSLEIDYRLQIIE